MVMKIKDALKLDKEDTRIILAYLLDKSYGWIDRNPDQELSRDIYFKTREILHKVQMGYPIQYALGKWDFYGRTFMVNPGVLIPRPETELLVEQIILDNEGPRTILDMGTGSGAIAISLKLERNDFYLTATDISDPALKMAEQNAKRLGANITFVKSDLFDQIFARFDVIVSNPPYISKKDYDNLDKHLYFEPKIALLAGEKGHEIYEKIIDRAIDHLNPEGRIYFEIGYDQGEVVSGLLKDKGFKDVQVIKDYGGKDRIVKGHI